MQQWEQTPPPHMYPPARGSASQRNTWWMVIAVVLTVLLLGMIAYYVISEQKDNATAPSASTSTGQRTVTVQEQPPVTVTETLESPVTVTSETTIRQTVPNNAGAHQWSALMNSTTSCEDPNYAGTNGVDYISVCQGDKGLEYRAWVNGKSLELSGRTERLGYGYYLVDANPNNIEIDGPKVTVYNDNGEVFYGLYLPQWAAA